MKVEVIEKEDSIWENIKYPCLGKAKTSELIVYFADRGVGVVLQGNEERYPGYYSEYWIMHTFKKLEGKFILEND